MNNREIVSIKENLLSKLKSEKAFWSYDQDAITASNIQDDDLIAETMRHLDLPEIKQLFTIFSFKKVKKAWISKLIPEGEYLQTLNRFFAWYYFKAKKPDAYIKSLYTRYLNSFDA